MNDQPTVNQEQQGCVCGQVGPQVISVLEAACLSGGCSVPSSDRPAHAAKPEPNRATSATELCRRGHIKLRSVAESLLRDDLSPQKFFDLLVSHSCLADARRVLAMALPKRRALWWGCLCSIDAYQDHMPAREMDAIEAVVNFVHAPSDANRRATSTCGMKAGVNTLGGTLAMATFFSMGSVSLPGLPHVAPRPFVTGRLVGVAVYLASVKCDPRRYKEHLRNYLALGRAIAAGKTLWAEPQRLEVARVDTGQPQPVSGKIHGHVTPSHDAVTAGQSARSDEEKQDDQ